MKKKLIIIVIILAVIVGTFFVTGGFEKFVYKYNPVLYGTLYRDGRVWDPVKGTNKFLPYTSEEFKISFEYPAGYMVNDEPRGEEGVKVVADISSTIYVKSPDNKYAEGIIIVEVQLSPEDLKQGINNIVSSISKSYVNGDYDVTEVDRDEILIEGIKGEYLVYDVNDKNTGLRTSKETFVINNNKLYRFTFTDSKEEYSDSIKLFDRVLASFKFI